MYIVMCICNSDKRTPGLVMTPVVCLVLSVETGTLKNFLVYGLGNYL